MYETRPPQPQAARDPKSDLQLAGTIAIVPVAVIALSLSLGLTSDRAQEWLARGWLVTSDQAVVPLGNGVGLDPARLALPAAAVLSGCVFALSYLVSAARKDSPAPYRVWQRDVFLLLLTAAVMVLTGPTVFGLSPLLAWFAVVWLVVSAVAVGAFGVRANRRHSDRARLIEQLAPVVGDQPRRHLVLTRGWSQEWPTGVPAKVIVRYPSATLELDGERQAEILRKASAVGWGAYRLDRIDARRHRLILTSTQVTAAGDS